MFSMLALVWVLYAVGPAAAKSEGDEGLKVGAEAPVFSMRVLNAKESGTSFLSLDDYVGKDAKKPVKLTILSFFATYCDPCKKELPVLQELWTKYKDKGLIVIVVSIDKGTNQAGGIMQLIKEKGLTYPVIHDKFQILAKRYRVGRLPYLTLMDGNGKITMVNIGYTESFTKKLIATIEERLGVSPGGDKTK